MVAARFEDFRLRGQHRRQPARTRLCLVDHVDQPDDPARRPGILLKILAEPASARELALFDHECRLLAALNHPAIPSYHGHGRGPELRWLAMDYVEGLDLAELLGHGPAPAGPLHAVSPAVAVYVLAQLADALDHVHGLAELDPEGDDRPLGVLHRDLTPSNVVVSVEGDVLLVDFGVATSRLLPAAEREVEVGSKAYLAPERAIGGGASIKSELFALAAIGWELLKGQRLLWAGDELATLDAIAKFDPLHPSRRLAGVSSKLAEVIRRNLDRDPARRYDDAYQVLQRLSQAPEAQQAEEGRAELGALVVQRRAELGLVGG